MLKSARIRNIRGKSEYIRIGNKTIVAGELLVFPSGGEINIGDWCFIGENARIWSAASISIGNRVLISHDVNIMDSLTHPYNAQERHHQFRAIVETGHPEVVNIDQKPINIDDDVWISAKSIILRGITIGKGSVIGAGSIVTRDVAANSLVAGNPARLIRKLSDGE